MDFATPAMNSVWFAPPAAAFQHVLVPKVSDGSGFDPILEQEQLIVFECIPLKNPFIALIVDHHIVSRLLIVELVAL